MSRTRQSVRIIVTAPLGWDLNNLSGTIVKERYGKILIVKLTNAIKGYKFSSDLIELIPRFENETFKALAQHYALEINGSLISESSEEKDFPFVGIVTYD